jgi:ribosomal protein S18 acetylase RimI-like enzyme
LNGVETSVADFTVRSRQPDDDDRIAELAGQLGYPGSGRDVGARLDRMRDPDQYGVYVAELDGRIVGLYIFRTVETDGHAEISGLVVDESCRSRGVGAALMRAGEAWARERGSDTITVRTNVTRERAHAFYRREGYGWVKRQETFRKRLTDQAS